MSLPVQFKWFVWWCAFDSVASLSGSLKYLFVDKYEGEHSLIGVLVCLLAACVLFSRLWRGYRSNHKRTGGAQEDDEQQQCFCVCEQKRRVKNRRVNLCNKPPVKPPSPSLSRIEIDAGALSDSETTTHIFATPQRQRNRDRHTDDDDGCVAVVGVGAWCASRNVTLLDVRKS